MIFNHIVFAGFIFCSCVASAGEIEHSKQYSVCMDKSDGVTVDMINCIVTETRFQDARLNKAYKIVMAQLLPERKKQLQDVQRIWLKFRDANCDFYSDPVGGTAATVSSHECYLNSITLRARELETFVQ